MGGSSDRLPRADADTSHLRFASGGIPNPASPHVPSLGAHYAPEGDTSGSFSSGVDALQSTHLYPNNADCQFFAKPGTLKL